MTFTKKQIEQLYPAEVHFQNAIRDGVVRNCRRTLLDTVADIYDEATKSTSRRKWSCPTCVYNFLKMVGKAYFADKKTYTKRDEQKRSKIKREEDQAS